MATHALDRPLLPGEYAVLGLLALGPSHGYEMAHTLAGDLAAVRLEHRVVTRRV